MTTRRLLSQIFTLIFLIPSLGSCQDKTTINTGYSAQDFTQSIKRIEEMDQTELSKAYFASGCFWCVEAIYERLTGVVEVVSGYAGGQTPYPTYGASNTGLTGHAEAVVVYYDPNLIDFATLLKVYFASQNISQFNGQGPDHGSQYRSIIFYQNQEEAEIINQQIKALEKQIGQGKVAAEVQAFDKFWPAEDYHQNYEANHPYHPYIVNTSIPRLKRVMTKLPELFKKSE
ncbi:peptide-methionine (S)-S-oxide reductase MsrA [Flavobacteriaceae bacterium]|nr:peptide-methionine (S)-S-oxide reductase MsrA [Flavobacteriaceae bacterium]